MRRVIGARFYPAEKIEGPRLLLGSHLDTVPNAGAFDGILGVVIAVSLLQALHGRRLPFGIEVIGFSEEEGVRFGAPFIGSRALVGRLDEALLSRQDAQGISVRQAIADFGLSPEEIPGVVLKNDILGYVEFHIEQGPVLENLGRPLAAVEAIAGQEPIGVYIPGPHESRRYHTHESALRCSGRSSRMDFRSRRARWPNTRISSDGGQNRREAGCDQRDLWRDTGDPGHTACRGRVAQRRTRCPYSSSGRNCAAARIICEPEISSDSASGGHGSALVNQIEQAISKLDASHTAWSAARATMP